VLDADGAFQRDATTLWRPSSSPSGAPWRCRHDRGDGVPDHGRVPRTSLALEASAGTGKTWTLTSLAVRYVAEGDVELPDLLLVTFTRAATAELRERVRRRLAEATTA
jgi:hypothetical protein